MNIAQIAKWRYTCKSYDKNKKISAQDFIQLLEVLHNVPTSVNSQPLHYIIAHTPAQLTRLLPGVADFNAERLTTCSHLIVIAVKANLDEDYLRRILAKEQADGRFATPQLAAQQHEKRVSFAVDMYPDLPSRQNWESKQAYIALGQLTLAAACLGIDSTPMEGFDPAKIDELLQLPQKGFKSVLLVALGYRSDADFNATLAKSRLSKEEMFTLLSD